MNVVLLFGGGSQAFSEAGHIYPKTLIEINGRPVVEHVLRQFEGLPAKLVAVCAKEDVEAFHLDKVVKLLCPDIEVVKMNNATSGAACSALLAVEHFVDGQELLIVNGDQLIEEDFESLIDQLRKQHADAGTVVFEDIHPRWSFVKTDEQGNVIEASEKRPISNLATAGIYYFRQSEDFVSAVFRMIHKGASVNDLFYVCPTFNELILEGKKIRTVATQKDKYHTLATPQRLNAYIQRFK